MKNSLSKLTKSAQTIPDLATSDQEAGKQLPAFFFMLMIIMIAQA